MQLTQPSEIRRVRAWLAVLLILGAAARFHGLDHQSLWADELCRIVWAKGYEFDRWFGFLPSETGARLPARDLRHSLSVVNAHNPPLNAAVLNLSMRAARSDSDWVARSSSALFSLISIGCAFLAASQLLGPAVGVWAAALVAFSPFHIFYAQEVNHYALGACLVALSLWFYFRWRERPALGAGAGLALSGLAALYAHYYAGIVLLFQAIDLLAAHAREPRRLVRLAVPYVAIGAGFAPYLPTLRIQLHEMTHASMVGTFQGSGHFVEHLRAMLAVPWLGERGENLTPLAAIAIGALALSLFVAGVRAQRDPAVRRTLLVLSLGPIATIAVLYWVMRSNSIVWSRYQLFFTFTPFIAIGAGLQRGGLLRWVAGSMLAALMIVGVWFLKVDLVKEDWKGVAAAIASRGSTDENVLVYRPNLTYAVGRYLQPEHRLFGVDDIANLASTMTLAADGRSGTWFVSAWVDRPKIPERVHALLACRYAHREDFPVMAGRVAIAVTRYSDPRLPVTPASLDGGPDTCRSLAADGALATWERPVAGPAIEAGMIDAPANGERLAGSSRSLTVAGWAFSTRGIQSLVFALDGRAMFRARHAALLRPDVAAAYSSVPEDYTVHSGFWGVIDMTGADPGVHVVSVSGVHADGSASAIASRFFTSAPPTGPRADR